jgi:FMN-dependent oxidoreductase (nitrilotriacetate monooxygenase family)
LTPSSSPTVPALADNVRYAQRFRFEPITWLAAIAAATQRIGLIATAWTTYTEPYNLARLFASLDHISHGRAGWNIVTTTAPQAAQNFGLPEHPPHHERYERAQEFLDVVTRLWDSWEDDALVNDPASGIFADTDKIRAIDHIGKHFRVRGPSNISRPPQGRPVYVQAGASDDGRAFAARYAEAIFTAHHRRSQARRNFMPTSSGRPVPSTVVRTDQNSAGHQSLHRQYTGRGGPAAGRIQRTDTAGIFADAVATDDRARSLRVRSRRARPA